MSLSDFYKLRERFQRSARLDADLSDPRVLEGYFVSSAAWESLQRVTAVVNSSPQRAFTWTGPYGGGKSSLGLFLSSLVSRDATVRKRAEALLGRERLHELAPLIPKANKGWVVARVVATEGDPDPQIARALREGAVEQWGSRKCRDLVGDDVIKYVTAIAGKAKQSGGQGLLLIVDELGRFLRHAATHAGRLDILQDLAELFCRLDTNCLLIGILHQSFQEYAEHLDQKSRDEWAKVQGRFVDVPFSVDLLESVELIAKAISGPAANPDVSSRVRAIANSLSRPLGRSADLLTETLRKCWPLHPLSALLLGPISRRKFGQNERTIFGFLCSGEPSGFRVFLEEADDTALGYEPSSLWDYLQLNLEPAILASPDGHRWAEAAEGVDRVSKLGTPLHLRLAKTIALVDLFGRVFQVRASSEVLRSVFWDSTHGEIDTALADLKGWSVAVFREHLNSWAIFSGSDLDLDGLLAEAIARVDPEEATQRALCGVDLPIVAKRHYVMSGTLRWFVTSSVSAADLNSAIDGLKLPVGCDGSFVLVLHGTADDPAAIELQCQAISRASLKRGYPVALGIPRTIEIVRHLACELAAYREIRSANPSLDGDAVARRELSARESAASLRFESAIREAFATAVWFIDGKRFVVDGEASLSQLASKLALRAFPGTPILRNELVNREKPSSNAVAARRVLMHGMVKSSGIPHLGIEGNPPEMAIYLSVIKAPGFHRPQTPSSDFWVFSSPSSDNEIGQSCAKLWESFQEFLRSTETRSRTISDLYDICRARPFGLRPGVLPILALIFILAHEEELALYVEGVFYPALDDFFVDRMLQDPRAVSVRRFEVAGLSRFTLEQLSKLLGSDAQHELHQVSALSIAKPLVTLTRNLTPWVKRTRRLDLTTLAVRDAILRADDPYVLLLEWLPQACGLEAISPKTANREDIDVYLDRLVASIAQLRNAYRAMLVELKRSLAAAFGFNRLDSVELDRLSSRATALIGRSGDLRLDAFAQRVSSALSDSNWIEGAASLAINKPSRDWTDQDLEKAKLELTELADRFRRIERLIVQKGGSGVSFSLLYRDPSETLDISHTADWNSGYGPALDSATQDVVDVIARHELPASFGPVIIARVLKRLLPSLQSKTDVRSNVISEDDEAILMPEVRREGREEEL